jgi:hypothetical protein
LSRARAASGMACFSGFCANNQKRVRVSRDCSNRIGPGDRRGLAQLVVTPACKEKLFALQGLGSLVEAAAK